MNPKPKSPSLHRSTKNPTFHGKILNLAEKDGLIWHPDLKVLVDIDYYFHYYHYYTSHGDFSTCQGGIRMPIPSKTPFVVSKSHFSLKILSGPKTTTTARVFHNQKISYGRMAIIQKHNRKLRRRF